MLSTFAPLNETALTPSNLKENLVAGRYDFAWAETTRTRKLTAIRKAQKMFARSGLFVAEEDFPGTRDDLEFFAATRLGSVERTRGLGFKTVEAARTWVQEYSTILDVASAVHDAELATRVQDDDFAELLAHLTGKRGAPVILGNYPMNAVMSFVMRCRENGRPLRSLDLEAIGEISGSLPESRRKTFLRGLACLLELHGSNCVPAELLPKVDPVNLQRLAGPETRVVPPLNPAFLELMERFLLEASTGQVAARFGPKTIMIDTEEKSVARIKNLRDAVRWLWHGLVVLGIADHEKPFQGECLYEAELIMHVIRACASGRLGPISTTQTRRDRTMDAIAFLEWNCPGLRDRLPRSIFSAKEISRRFTRVTEDRQKKEAACLTFVNSKEEQRIFFTMPQMFYDEARPIIESFSAHTRPDGNGMSKAQNRALEQGIMAALTAIRTVYPTRLATAAQFMIDGPHPNVIFPDEHDDRRDCVMVTIPGHMVKNRKSLTSLPLRATGKMSPRKILRWYIDEVHPLVLRYKHKHASLRRPELLFTGLHHDTIHRYWTSHTAEMGLALTPHMCRHFLASLLISNSVPIADVAQLLGISETVTARHYAFIAETQVVQNVISAQLKIYQELDL